MTTAHDLMPPDTARVRSAQRPVDAARETAARGAGALPGRGPDEEPAGMLTDRRVDVRAVVQGMPSP
ncbi:hypothetical protein [Streptomyces zaomyceticus]|uniref:hypothetical protein n=1 Tax=Streptomyces zaomyceticus TaxID=68286 RepID=UPI0034463DDA